MQKTLPIHFAPLQGYTDVIYRNAHAACFGGIDTYYTPFVRLEKGGFRHRDVRGIEPGNNQVPHLIPQLIAPSFEKAENSFSHRGCAFLLSGENSFPVFFLIPKKCKRYLAG